MKKSIIVAAMIVLALPLAAQRHDDKHPGKKHRDVTELVSDLSASQKRKIDAVSRESKERVSVLRTRQKAVRDSIGMFMEREGDQSAALYPLFDREAQLQVSISREMYATKVKVDALLTKEQKAELKKALKDRR